MLIPVTPEYRKRRGKYGRRTTQQPDPPPPPPVAPTLTAAIYFPAQEELDLTFDRAVDVSAIVPAQLEVDDPTVNLTKYRGTGTPTTPTPERVVLSLTPFDISMGSEQTLNASATTGIVAVDGGLPWAGVTNLDLPFP